MIVLKDKQDCCGCGACYQVCPKQCIEMSLDEEGFLYPSVNLSSCVDCHLCEKVCPVLNPNQPNNQSNETFAAINTNDPIRMESSSGGIFTLLAEYIIEQGGVVFGARFNEDWQVVHSYTETKEGLSAFRGSKYMQSETKNTYQQAQSFLESGRMVLYTGTSCQIAGLKNFLRKDYDNLLSVDVICHGAPSPKVWQIYLNQVVDNAKSAIKDIEFRNKDNGWKRFNFKLIYNKDNKDITLSSFHGKNNFMRAFLSDMILRPSCYNCQAKNGKSNSDITLADFWGIQNVLPSLDDNKGTSLLIANTDKGKQLLQNLNNLSLQEVSFAEAIKYNPAYYRSATAHPHRKDFFLRLSSAQDIITLIEQELKPTPLQRLRLIPSRSKHLIIRVIKRIVGGGVEIYIPKTLIPQPYHCSTPIYTLSAA